MSGSEYQLFIQKQPGKEEVVHEVTVNGQKQSVPIRRDKKISFRL